MMNDSDDVLIKVTVRWCDIERLVGEMMLVQSKGRDQLSSEVNDFPHQRFVVDRAGVPMIDLAQGCGACVRRECDDCSGSRFLEKFARKGGTVASDSQLADEPRDEIDRGGRVDQLR